MNDKEFGMFGTANGLGRVIGSSIYLIIVNNFNRKFVFAFFVLWKAAEFMSARIGKGERRWFAAAAGAGGYRPIYG